MRILVVSDSHGDIFHLMQAVREPVSYTHLDVYKRQL